MPDFKVAKDGRMFRIGDRVVATSDGMRGKKSWAGVITSFGKNESCCVGVEDGESWVGPLSHVRHRENPRQMSASEFLYQVGIVYPKRILGIVAANKGTEVPFVNANGQLVLYVFDVISKQHGYMDIEGGLFLDADCTHYLQGV